MTLIGIAGVLLLWFVFGSKIQNLENRIKELESGVKSEVELSAIPKPGLVREDVNIEARLYPVPPETSAPNKVVTWLKEDFMVKLGALLLIIALGWFVSYAIDSGWIGPAGQIVIGLAVGVLFLMLGVWRINKLRHQGGIFTVLGATIVLLTMFAAREAYDLFTPTSALAVMFMTVVFVSFVSVRYNSQNLSFAGLLMASVAPFLTASPTPSAIGLFTYLMFVTIGSLGVVWVTGWTRIILASLTITYFYSISIMFGNFHSDRDLILMYSLGFVSIYFLANIVSLIRRNAEGKKYLTIHTLTALGTAIFLVTWLEEAMLPDWKGVMYAVWAVIFGVGTYLVFKFTANRNVFYLYGAISVGLIGAATASEFSGPVLTLVYLFEIGLLILASKKLNTPLRTLSYISLLLAVPISHSVDSFSQRDWSYGIFHEHFAVLLAVTIVTFVVGLFIKKQGREASDSLAKIISYTILVIASFYAVAVVWLSLHALLSDDIATTLSLVLYTVSGIILFVVGTTDSVRALRIWGGVLVGGVVARLLLVDIWDMPLEGRIVTFLIIGALLISTAFIGKLRKSQSSEMLN